MSRGNRAVGDEGHAQRRKTWAAADYVGLGSAGRLDDVEDEGAAMTAEEAI
eukprot:NODE_4302_length_817_cov_3.024740_g3562_i0.p6 GENE.NODE_4302_length_817_cov_3.024740_g3562_i0~~NODE_4302_length_817_cov_3.024740_g3562_i0.p6  ORF type:complete len:51 (-),score=3.75 NODE_4302_length_817_cov_3.024740_g3562_i0:465-617(-)